MKDINNVIIIGRQTRDIGEQDFGYTNAGTARLNLSLAVNNTRKEGDQYVDDPSFINVTVWGKTAENIRGFVCKGKQIAVKGHLQQQRWETQDGQKRSALAVIADDVQLLGSKNDGQSGGYNQQMQQQFAQTNSYAQQQQFAQQQQTPQQVQAIANAFDGNVQQGGALY